ncbi:MAG TPA: DUF1801 domain-containing protein [Chitinophagaceae bacterium]|nr:DUF1801 domain-containing protein [Chitinophagaceae bacterium]
MLAKQTPPANVDIYISGFSGNVRELLQKLRNIIRKQTPGAEEIISYQMPAFTYNGVLVYFAGYKNHIGFYPTSSGINAFKDELSAYKWSKGAIQFPLDKPLPLALIKRIVKFRVAENREKLRIRQERKTSTPKRKVKKR